MRRVAETCLHRYFYYDEKEKKMFFVHFALLGFSQNRQKTNSGKSFRDCFVAGRQPQLPARKMKLYLRWHLCVHVSFEFEAAVADTVSPRGVSLCPKSSSKATPSGQPLEVGGARCS